MKILHCCLAAFYIDNYSYQENILPKMHLMQGYDVEIVASTEIFINNSVIGYCDSGSYLTSEKIQLTRISYAKWLPHFLSKKLRIYTGLSQVINSFQPDIIFLHGPQFLGICEIIGYKKKYPKVTIYADNHTDFINSGKNWASRILLHGFLYKWCVKKVIPFTKKFYGVLPIRVQFLKEVYGVPADKVELLELGADLTNVDLSHKGDIRKEIRKQLNISENDLVLITGGKIDKRKNIDLLMQTIIKLNIPDIKLIVFGTPSEELKDVIEDLSKYENIRNIGWITSESVYNYYLASNLAVFPGTHSVLWEQAVGTGLPCIFKRWEGMQHVDVGGNCLFYDYENELEQLILLLHNNREKLSKMRQIAQERGMKQFSYYDIAKRAIES